SAWWSPHSWPAEMACSTPTSNGIARDRHRETANRHGRRDSLLNRPVRLGPVGPDAPVLRQVAGCPAAAERLVEAQDRVQPLKLVVEKRVARREQRVLRHEHRLEVRDTFAVAGLGDAERLFGGVEARSRDFPLLFEQLDVGQRDLDVVKSSEHRAAVARETALERQLRLLDVAPALAVVEQHLHQARRDTGKALRRRRHDVRELEARRRRSRRQRNLREQLPTYDADVDRSAAQAHLGLIEIRAAHQELRRQAGLNTRYLDVLQRLARDVEALNVSADENGKRRARRQVGLNEAQQCRALLLDLDLLLKRVDRHRDARVDARLRDATDDLGVLQVLAR